MAASASGPGSTPPHRDHPWWRHVPAAERGRRRAELNRIRLLSFLRRRGTIISATLLFYLGLCLIPLALGQPHLSLFALLPVLAIPPVAYMAYLIAWHEFHR